jgi:hypothetical protein
VPWLLSFASASVAQQFLIRSYLGHEAFVVKGYKFESLGGREQYNENKALQAIEKAQTAA